jgi:hypothetical protein
MRVLSALELLNVWENGLTRRPDERALILLTAACPEVVPEALAQLSIGQRDAHLLTLREWTFGPHLACLAICPKCGERLELTFNTAEIRATTEAEPGGAILLSVADYEVRFRLPNSADLAVIASHDDIVAARDVVLQRCLLQVTHNGEAASANQLPTEVVEAVAARMAAADPQADIQLALSCPSCRHQWEMTFDIVSFFWSEIHAWAYRILREVHTLASAYGWREADILAVSPWRRQLYLEMVGG